ncbi:MAG: hypothetical protein ACREBS_04215 [Nitrososphaerales archaeon]
MYHDKELYWVGSIGGFSIPGPEVGVATSNGRAYYRISSLLKRIGLPFSDIILGEKSVLRLSGSSMQGLGYLNGNVKLIITTRRERLQVQGSSAICVEDLGEDVGVAKERLLSLLYPSKPSDWFVVGIDPGERTGVAAFINHREVESSVLPTLETTISRISELIDNAPNIRKIVKIGSGNMKLARMIAGILEARYKDSIRIFLVDESGTSSLVKKTSKDRGTRDQRAAKLIAFREGQDYALIN